jgi:hypothetical protein
MINNVELAGEDSLQEGVKPFTQGIDALSILEVHSELVVSHEQNSVNSLEKIANYLDKGTYLYCGYSNGVETIKVQKHSYEECTMILSGTEAFKYIMFKKLDECWRFYLTIDKAIKCVRDILQCGIDINQAYNKPQSVWWFPDSWSPYNGLALLQATKCKRPCYPEDHLDLVNFLLDNGALITPDVLALSYEEGEETINNLIARNININVFDDKGGVLHRWCSKEGFIKFFLEEGVNPNVIDSRGRSVLHYTFESACYWKPFDRAVLLIDYGADLYLEDNEGVRPLALAKLYTTVPEELLAQLEVYYKKYQEQRLQLEKAKNTHLADIEGVVSTSSSKELQINDTLEDQLDIKLKELVDKFIHDKPEYAEEIEKTGYTELKRQLIEAAKQQIKAKQIQDKSQDTTLLDTIGYGVNELFGIHEAKANPLVAVVIAEEIITYGGALLISLLITEKAVSDYNQHSELDENFNKPKILSTPIPKQLNTTETFPQKDPNKFEQLPGFIPSDLGIESLQEGFDPYETKLEDLIFYKDYQIDHWNVKPASVKDAPEVYRCGKFGKIYQDPEQTVGNKEIWWSKDTANHGGASQGLTPSTYKLFVIKDGIFQWIGDADATGKVIKGKHKGEIGEEIKIKDCWKVK